MKKITFFWDYVEKYEDTTIGYSVKIFGAIVVILLGILIVNII